MEGTTKDTKVTRVWNVIVYDSIIHRGIKENKNKKVKAVTGN